jgi:hypothetical protein
VVAVELLLALLGSVVPPGGDAVAVFANEPVAEADTVPLMVSVTLAPAGKVGMAPDTVLPLTPIVVGHAAPANWLPQLAETLLMFAGTTSLKVAPLALLGPSFRMTI